MANSGPQNDPGCLRGLRTGKTYGSHEGFSWALESVLQSRERLYVEKIVVPTVDCLLFKFALTIEIHDPQVVLFNNFRSPVKEGQLEENLLNSDDHERYRRDHRPVPFATITIVREYRTGDEVLVQRLLQEITKKRVSSLVHVLRVCSTTK